MPTALIAEDEPMLRAQLKSRLHEAWPELRDIVEAENGEQALALIDECRPDVAFLDISMPVRSGLDVARAIEGRCHVVFVTAYDEYAIAAFDEGAVDYVLKPVASERIAKVVARVKARLATGHTLEYADFGGGYGIDYSGGSVPAPSDFVRSALEPATPTVPPSR